MLISVWRISALHASIEQISGERTLLKLISAEQISKGRIAMELLSAGLDLVEQTSAQLTSSVWVLQECLLTGRISAMRILVGRTSMRHSCIKQISKGRTSPEHASEDQISVKQTFTRHIA